MSSALLPLSLSLQVCLEPRASRALERCHFRKVVHLRRAVPRCAAQCPITAARGPRPVLAAPHHFGEEALRCLRPVGHNYYTIFGLLSKCWRARAWRASPVWRGGAAKARQRLLILSIRRRQPSPAVRPCRSTTHKLRIKGFPKRVCACFYFLPEATSRPLGAKLANTLSLRALRGFPPRLHSGRLRCARERAATRLLRRPTDGARWPALASRRPPHAERALNRATPAEQAKQT